MLYIVTDGPAVGVNPRIPYGPFVKESVLRDFPVLANLGKFFCRSQKFIPVPVVFRIPDTGFIEHFLVVVYGAYGCYVPWYDVKFIVQGEPIHYLRIILADVKSLPFIRSEERRVGKECR